MKTLILYGSTHSCSKKCADILAGKLQTSSSYSLDIDIVNAKGNTELDVAEYEILIIGGSIRLGKMNKAISNFCKKNLDDLVLKKTGFFVCCLNKRDRAKEHMRDNFPYQLLEGAMAKGFFGGELNFEEMAAIERALLKTVMQHEKSVSLIDEDAIERFAKKILSEI